LILVIVRVLTLIVSAALVIGTATQLGWAFDDDTAGYSIDDDRPVDPAAMPTTTPILARRHQAAPVVWDVVPSPGRLHAVSVFRPPRA
jgi:hypothetical protein